jgi:SAM-dependent methyltransferase
MQADYAQQYETLWRRHWWWRARERFVGGQLARLAHGEKTPPSQRRILDIGCGNGLFFDTLSQYGNVSGIEPDAGLVTEGPHREKIDVRGFDASYVPLATFDWVVMLDVLEHIEDDVAAARHVREILAPGGIVLVTVPALMMLWSQHDTANHHFRRYTRGHLRRVLSQAGLDVLFVRYFFGWTIGPMLLRRVLRPAKGDAAYAVPVPPDAVNRGMYGASRFEQTVLTAGGRWGLPLGSSLIAVARKS